MRCRSTSLLEDMSAIGRITDIAQLNLRQRFSVLSFSVLTLSSKCFAPNPAHATAQISLIQRSSPVSSRTMWRWVEEAAGYYTGVYVRSFAGASAQDRTRPLKSPPPEVGQGDTTFEAQRASKIGFFAWLLDSEVFRGYLTVLA